MKYMQELLPDLKVQKLKLIEVTKLKKKLKF